MDNFELEKMSERELETLFSNVEKVLEFKKKNKAKLSKDSKSDFDELVNQYLAISKEQAKVSLPIDFEVDFNPSYVNDLTELDRCLFLIYSKTNESVKEKLLAPTFEKTKQLYKDILKMAFELEVGSDWLFEEIRAETNSILR